ncbi:MAG: MotA/TolQ/ExbB proton channel family protein [Bdellovibrionales bacterium]|nr:MotA/TolQ/ExbB proton channel family protein [Bdellovibrionales bacterium]
MTDKFFAIAQVAHEVTLWLLIILSVLSLAFILERFFTLSRVRKESEKVSGRLKEILQSNNLTELEELSRDKTALESRALSYGLRHVREKGVAGLEEIFSSFANIERPSLDRHLGFLATVGSNAPFIGLLGTVFGVMDAFRALGEQGDTKAVMIGISQSLVATAVGLIVAIPAVIAYNYFQKQVKGVMLNLESVKDLCLAYAKSGIKKV